MTIEEFFKIQDLTKKEEFVLRMRYGISDGIDYRFLHPHTLEEVGIELNITREGVRQIIERIKKRQNKKVCPVKPVPFIKDFRIRKGLSQEQLGTMFNVKRNTIRNWENGTTIPKDEVIYKLMELDVSMPDIIISTEYTPDVIKDARKRAGLTQQEFASALSVNIKTVVMWEKGIEKPRLNAKAKLQEFINNLSQNEIFMGGLTKAKYIMLWRKLHNLSQKELAELLNVSKTSIDTWEKEKIIPSNKIIIALRKLNTKASDIKTPFTDPIFGKIINLIPEELQDITRIRIGLFDGFIYDLDVLSTAFNISQKEAKLLTTEGIRCFIQNINNLKSMQPSLLNIDLYNALSFTRKK